MRLEMITVHVRYDQASPTIVGDAGHL